MKDIKKKYQIKNHHILALLFLVIISFSSVFFGVKFLLDQAQSTERNPVAICTENMGIRSKNINNADQIVAHYFPKGKTPPQRKMVHTDRKLVALTFDDGPGLESTERILNTLRKHDVKATFFVLGNKVEQNPDMLKKIHEEGHEIANHSYSHPDLTKLSEDEIKSQISQTNKLVKDTVGVDMIYLRPPYGAFNKTIEDISGQEIILWNVDSNDWRFRNGSKTVHHVLANLAPQSIILFHDIYSSSADAIETLIPELKKQGYEFFTISEYLEIMRPR